MTDEGDLGPGSDCICGRYQDEPHRPDCPHEEIVTDWPSFPVEPFAVIYETLPTRRWWHRLLFWRKPTTILTTCFPGDAPPTNGYMTACWTSNGEFLLDFGELEVKDE